MSLAPIALFAFNRPEHLQRTLSALAANSLAPKSVLTIFCDGPRTAEEKKLTDAVRSIAQSVTGFATVTVVAREKNMGCAASILDGIQHMFAQHENLIVIEDDVLCSPHTLHFLQNALEQYKGNSKIFAISAWSFPAKIFSIPKTYDLDVYAIPRFNVSGGWASWRNRFSQIDWDVTDYQSFKNSQDQRRAFNRGGADMSALLDHQMEGKVDAWDIRADYSRFKHGQYGINPVISYTTNIGYGSGTHTTEFTDKFDNDISLALPVEKIRWLHDATIDEKILASYQKVYLLPLWHRSVRFCLKKLRLFSFIKKILNK